MIWAFVLFGGQEQMFSDLCGWLYSLVDKNKCPVIRVGGCTLWWTRTNVQWFVWVRSSDCSCKLTLCMAVICFNKRLHNFCSRPITLLLSPKGTFCNMWCHNDRCVWMWLMAIFHVPPQDQLILLDNFRCSGAAQNQGWPIKDEIWLHFTAASHFEDVAINCSGLVNMARVPTIGHEYSPSSL